MNRVVAAGITIPTWPSAVATLALAALAVWLVDGILSIAFDDVLGNARCPTDAVGVWAGHGEVRLGLAPGEAPWRSDRPAAVRRRHLAHRPVRLRSSGRVRYPRPTPKRRRGHEGLSTKGEQDALRYLRSGHPC